MELAKKAVFCYLFIALVWTVAGDEYKHRVRYDRNPFFVIDAYIDAVPMKTGILCWKYINILSNECFFNFLFAVSSRRICYLVGK